MKIFLQNCTLILALYLLLGWTGAKLEWYHGLFIGIALGIYGWMEVHRYKKRRVLLSAEEFDKWIRMHAKDSVNK
jgi:hypothetical protein